VAAMAMITDAHRAVDGPWEDVCPTATWEAERIERRRKLLSLRGGGGAPASA
jgi:hypothetical protein